MRHALIALSLLSLDPAVGGQGLSPSVEAMKMHLEGAYTPSSKVASPFRGGLFSTEGMPSSRQDSSPGEPNEFQPKFDAASIQTPVSAFCSPTSPVPPVPFDPTRILPVSEEDADIIERPVPPVTLTSPMEGIPPELSTSPVVYRPVTPSFQEYSGAVSEPLLLASPVAEAPPVPPNSPKTERVVPSSLDSLLIEGILHTSLISPNVGAYRVQDSPVKSDGFMFTPPVTSPREATLLEGEGHLPPLPSANAEE